MSILDSMSPMEQEIFLQAIRQTQSDKITLGKARQVKEIAPIEEWLNSPYYLGPDCVRLYDVYKEHLSKIFAKDSPVNEIILTGGIGIGKSTVGIIAHVRKLYELSCYENIPALFDLMTTSKIVFLYFSLSKKQAQLTGYGQIQEMIDSIPYFRKEFPRNDKIDSLMLWEPSLLCTYGSDSGHAIGVVS